MRNPDLTLSLSSSSSSSESEASSHKKRKFSWDQLRKDSMIQTGVELQLQRPLPLDWERCLDLESGKMYYLNRRTLKRSNRWPREEKLDLELNISTLSNSEEFCSRIHGDSKRPKKARTSAMVAAACLKCHLLVMLSRSSPSCPNCKYLHSLPTQNYNATKSSSVNSLELETLRLLH